MTNSPRTNYKAKIAMEGAWRHARRFQTLRGGSVLQYMSEALTLAWSEVKASPVVSEADKIIEKLRTGKLSRSVWTGRRASGYVFGCAQR